MYSVRVCISHYVLLLDYDSKICNVYILNGEINTCNHFLTHHPSTPLRRELISFGKVATLYAFFKLFPPSHYLIYPRLADYLMLV